MAYKGDDEICTNVEFLQNSKGGESSSSAMATMVVFKFTIIWAHVAKIYLHKIHPDKLSRQIGPF